MNANDRMLLPRSLAPFVFVGATFLLATDCSCGEATGQHADAKKTQTKFTIGKETTYITKPINKDGYPDYVAALNERLREGVTTDNNANVLLWKALGPYSEGARMPPEFFAWLGIPEPPPPGDYFLDFEQFVRQQKTPDSQGGREKVLDQLGRARRRPWSAEQFPHIAAWLRANDKPLAVVIEGTKRSRYYSPLLPQATAKERGLLMSSTVISVQRCRGLALALTCRAMLKVEKGELADAWDDLLACHRLARHVGHGASLIEYLVCLALEQTAADADLAFLNHGQPSSKQIRLWADDYRKLPPVPALAEVLNWGERLGFLDMMIAVARGGAGTLERYAGRGPAQGPNLWANLFLASLDWDPALRTANDWHDRIVKAMMEADRGTREEKLESTIRDLKELKKKIDAPPDAVEFLLSAKERGQRMGDILVYLMIPAVTKIQHAADRAEQVQRNFHLALAQAAYRSDHGRYPGALSELAPKYLAKVSGDLFTEKPLIYRRGQDGYLLYSFGINGRDDEGRWYDDDPPGDDLSVRVPLPKLK